MRAIAIALVVAVPLSAQTRRPTRRPPPPPPTRVAPEMACPAPLGVGVRSKAAFCEVMAGRDPAGGVLIQIPPHKGPATLTFDLHNLHTYSEEQVRARRAYARYTATIGALTIDNTLLSRAVVQSEFRTAADLVDRVSGGAGPGGVKAVAPVGSESVYITVPAGIDQVSLLGETFDAITPAGHETVVMPGRPVAIVSNVLVEYKPAPPARKR